MTIIGIKYVKMLIKARLFAQNHENELMAVAITLSVLTVIDGALLIIGCCL